MPTLLKARIQCTNCVFRACVVQATVFDVVEPVSFHKPFHIAAFNLWVVMRDFDQVHDLPEIIIRHKVEAIFVCARDIHLPASTTARWMTFLHAVSAFEARSQRRRASPAKACSKSIQVFYPQGLVECHQRSLLQFKHYAFDAEPQGLATKP